MDLFVFEQTPGALGAVYLGNAQMINGLDSVMWIERYAPAGEFTLTGKVSNGYQTQLPLGSLISHTGTTELMIVESHEISDDGTSDSIIKISGRSFETYLENRILSAHGLFVPFPYPIPPINAITSYRMNPANTSWGHATYLIETHVYKTWEVTDDGIDNLRAASSITGLPTVNIIREGKIGPLYNTIQELLAEDNLGIKSVRPGPWNSAYAGAGPTGPFYRPTDFGFVIHNGIDRRQDVAFSWSDGDIKSGQYLWSIKNKKTSVLVQGKVYRSRVTDGTLSINQRMGYLDAADVDETVTWEQATEAMAVRGQQYLAAQKDINITRIELKENNSRFSYRDDYNVGDIVAVNGNYNTETVMRVTEFVEIQDSTGYSGYPTLEALV